MNPGTSHLGQVSLKISVVVLSDQHRLSIHAAGRARMWAGCFVGAVYTVSERTGSKELYWSDTMMCL